MHVTVLGSHGVVGKALVKCLIKHGHTVDEVDLKNGKDLRFPQSHYTSDFIFFLAYDVGGSKYLQNASQTLIENNVDIMRHTFKALEGKKFIFASSQMQSMYTPYGTLKRLGEHWASAIGGKSVRFWNVYGEETVDEKSHVIPDFIDQYVRTGEIRMLTDGTEERQFLHCDDCAECLVTLMYRYETLDDVTDISSFEWTSIHEIADMISPKVTCGDIVTPNIKNEPRRDVLEFWKPEIALGDYFKYLHIS